MYRVIDRLRAGESYRVAAPLARNDEFSKIAVINIFFRVLKKTPQLSVGGPAEEISR